MELDANNEIIKKLAAIASDPIYLPQSVEEAVVKDVASASSLPNGRERRNLIARLTGAGRKDSTAEVEVAINDLLDAGIIKSWQPSGTMATERSTYYQLTLEFAKLMSNYVKEHGQQKRNLLESNIKVKGTAISLADLSGFYKHVPWILETYPSLKEVYIGSVKLTREEAAILLGEIEKHSIFDKG